MSGATTGAAAERGGRLPAWMRPRDRESEGTGSLRLVETTLLVIVAVVLAVATINDVIRQDGINHRLTTDLASWRHYTGHLYHNLSIDQRLLGENNQREVVCGNTSPGAPKATTQICLAIWGPVVNGRRAVHGGWYLPAKVQFDERAKRYGCFGPAGRGMCPR
jgi:hypothetical protein